MSVKEISPKYIGDEVKRYLNNHPNVVDLTVVVDWLGDCIYINPEKTDGYYSDLCTTVVVQKKDSARETYTEIMGGICQE